MKILRYLSLLLVLFSSTIALGQNTSDFDPNSPTEPGEPVMPDPVKPDTTTYYVLTLLSEEGGSVKSGAGKYAAGTKVTVAANNPSTNFVFGGWTDSEGDTLSTSLSFEYVMPYRHVTLTAHYDFRPGSPTEPNEPENKEPEPTPVDTTKYYTLKLIAGEGGSITKGSGSYAAGTEVQVEASAPSTNFVFGYWTTQNGDTVSTSRSFTYQMPASDMTLTATYLFNPGGPAEPDEPVVPEPEPEPEPLVYHNLTVSGGEGGTISVGGNAISGKSTFSLAEGTSTAISVTLSTNFVFDGWYSADTLYSASRNFTFTMDSVDVELYAKYTFNPNAPAEPDQPVTSSNELYLMSVVGLPGETINYPIYLNNSDTIHDINFEIQFPKGMNVNLDSALVSKECVGYTMTYKLVGESSAGPRRAEATDSTGVEYNTYDVSLTGGYTPPGNTALLIIPVDIDEDIDADRYRVWLSQVTVQLPDSSVVSGSTRNGVINTDYEEPDSYAYLDNLISVGSYDWNISQARQFDPPLPQSETFDMTAIAQSLGCSDESFITFKGHSGVGTVTDVFTSANGYWYGKDGYVCEADDSLKAVSLEYDRATSSIIFTQAPNALKVGDEMTLNVYFTYKYKYYETRINLKVTEADVDRTFAVRYYVDSLLFHTDSLKYGMPIEAIDEPVKEGYTFSGWSEIPDTITQDVEVYGFMYLTGDVNGDNKINVGDISGVANVILGVREPLHYQAADVTGNGKYDVEDIYSLAYYIVYGSFSTTESNVRRTQENVEELLMPTTVVLSADGNASMSVSLAQEDIVSVQFDLVLPEGICIKSDIGGEYITANVENAANHYLMWREQEDGAMRVLDYSVTNKAFAKAKSGVVDIQLVADGNLETGYYPILFENIVMTRSDGKTFRGSSSATIATDATDIKNISDDTQVVSGQIFDLSGRRINKAERGVNIINGKKIIK